MRFKKLSLILFAIIILSNLSFAQEQITIDFFFSTTCPHCKAEFEFLRSIEPDCSHLNINYYEVNSNYELFKSFAERYNTTTSGVPRTFIEDKVYAGFTRSEGILEYNPVYKAYNGYENVILDHINSITPHDLKKLNETETCIVEEDTSDAGVKAFPKNNWAFLLIIIYGIAYFAIKRKLRSKNAKKYWISGLLLIAIISGFIFISSQEEVSIKNFAESLPFPFFVTVIALADGFNPCAFTVLIILLSLLTYTKSRKDMAIVGTTFVLTSAVMYFIFIMIMVLAGSWAFQRYGQYIMMILGIFITIAGIINIKDYFFFKKGISLTISDKEKASFTGKARDIVNRLRESSSKRSFLLALIATIFLAVFVNLVELGCTAILPAVYMASLIKSFGDNISISHVVWTTYYSFIYILPLLAILFSFIYSFKSTRISEKQGRILKLVSGLFMLFFGTIMLFFPEMLVFG